MDKKAVIPINDVASPAAGKVALKFFFGLAEKLSCTADQQRVLLGNVSATTFYKYKKLPETRLPHDTLERISYLMGIYKALRIIFSTDPDRVISWLRSPNSAAPFNSRSALDYMLGGSVVDLADVRRYLDAVRG